MVPANDVHLCRGLDIVDGSTVVEDDPVFFPDVNTDTDSVLPVENWKFQLENDDLRQPFREQDWSSLIIWIGGFFSLRRETA